MSTAAHLGGASEHDANTWMPDVWGYLLVKYRIGILLDIGCGYGAALKWWSEYGVNCVGIDGDPKALEASAFKGTLVQHDFASGPYVHGTPFDLAWSAEFLEHLAEEHLPNVAPCFQAARYACITHGEPHQHGQHHANCRPSSYWVRQFEHWGFEHREDETLLLRLTDRWHAGWGRRTLMFFERL